MTETATEEVAEPMTVDVAMITGMAVISEIVCAGGFTAVMKS
jgi:hypothetical protein